MWLVAKAQERQGIYTGVRVFLEPYSSRSGNTGVIAYALLEGGILVQFQDGKGYLYDESRPGTKHLAKMVALAQAGRGLSTYISQHIGDNYAGRFSAEEIAMLRKQTDER